MRACLFLLALAVAAAADPPLDLKEHRALVRKLDRAERKYWRDFPNRFSDAYKNFEAPFSGKGGVDPEAVYDFRDMRKLFGDYRAIMQAWANADAALGAAALDKAWETLFAELLLVCKRMDKAEAEFEKARPIDSYVFNQRPAIQLDGLAIRLEGLVRAVVKWPMLATAGWEKARKADGRKKTRRRVAVIDALALGGADLKAFVAHDKLPVRVAVAESLFDVKALAPLLQDKEQAVRRALLQTILKKGAEQPQWIGPVLDHFVKATGQEKAETLAVLGALTGQKFGYDAGAWAEWFDAYKKEIEAGKFDKTKIEIDEVKPKPARGETRFFGIPTTSLRVVILAQADSIIFCPADRKHRAKKTEWDWRSTRKTWENRALPSHAMVLKQQLDAFRKGLVSAVRFGFVTMQGDFDTPSTEKLLDLSVKSETLVNKLIDKMTGRGWCSPMIGLDAATALGPGVDTVYFLHSGKLRGGKRLTPELVVAAFRRWNRFRRVVVHTIRIDDQKEAGEALMKGLAEFSSGTYVWFEKPKP